MTMLFQVFEGYYTTELNILQTEQDHCCCFGLSSVSVLLSLAVSFSWVYLQINVIDHIRVTSAS